MTVRAVVAARRQPVVAQRRISHPNRTPFFWLTPAFRARDPASIMMPVTCQGLRVRVGPWPPWSHQTPPGGLGVAKKPITGKHTIEHHRASDAL